MIELPQRIRDRLKWRTDESGSVAVETLMMVPLMLWAMVATLTYFDAYRAQAVSNKAGLTIADMISRETDYINNSYLSGARDMLDFLAVDDNWPDLRVTVFRYQASDQSYRRVWSRERGPRKPLTGQEVIALGPKFPLMSDGERAILVETWIDYKAPWTQRSPVPLGVSDYTLETFNVISPRYATQLCWNNTTIASNAIC